MLRSNLTIVKSMEDEKESLMSFLKNNKNENEYVTVALTLRVREIERDLKFIKDAFH